MGCAIATIKYLLFFFNFFITLCGITFIVIGFVTNSKGSNFKELMAGNLSTISMVVIAVGVVIFIVAFFGCCGAIQESHCLITTYAMFLLTICFIEIGIGVYAFVNRANAQKALSETVDHIFDKYETKPDYKRVVDAVQRELRCCGTNGPQSWAGKIPASCCIGVGPTQYDTTFVSSCPNDDEKWTAGCVEKLTEIVKDSLSLLGYIALGVGITELAGIVFALCLASSIKRSELGRGYA